MNSSHQRWPFGLFFLSGFSGLVYQIVWLRLAFASFGIVTPVMSVLLSVFMLGLGLGSWLAGRVVGRGRLSRAQSLKAYALAETLIGIGGVVVPSLFIIGERLLLPVGETNSVTYLACSGGIILLALLPFCVAMGFTFPLMMQAMRAGGESSESFSYLYLANVIGAMCGTLLAPVVLVELLGFHQTLWIGAAANWTAAAVSLWKSGRPALSAVATTSQPTADAPPLRVAPSVSSAAVGELSSPLRLWILFATGLASMAIEVVWTRAFTPVLKTQVYSFSGLLFTYLLATWCGSWLYRRHLRRGMPLSARTLLSLLALAAFGQLLLVDPRIDFRNGWLQVLWTLCSIVPYSGILGYLTPKLIDEYSTGNPESAGRAYAVNVLGCIIGPLLASYVLLPHVGVLWSGILLALPLWGLAGWVLGHSRSAHAAHPRSLGRIAAVWGLATLCGLLAGAVCTSYEEHFAKQGAVIHRDYTGTVAAYEKGGKKELLVNGIHITSHSSITKFMAHLPLAHLQHAPRSALVICFGMGTTYRSLLSWDIDTTAVELVPSVRDAFGYFFDDADEVRKNARGKIVIDDGRRFLRRTTEKFDVITLDPPPPIEAAGSSLLYSTEFYELVKARLSDQGILHQWHPFGEWKIFQATLRSVMREFPHVRILSGYKGWGVHILASQQPIPYRSAAELESRLPPKAQQDFVEWQDKSFSALVGPMLAAEVSPTSVLSPDPAVAITDDHPFNEYFVLRRFWPWWKGSFEVSAGPHPQRVKWSSYFR